MASIREKAGSNPCRAGEKRKWHVSSHGDGTSNSILSGRCRLRESDTRYQPTSRRFISRGPISSTMMQSTISLPLSSVPASSSRAHASTVVFRSQMKSHTFAGVSKTTHASPRGTDCQIYEGRPAESNTKGPTVTTSCAYSFARSSAKVEWNSLSPSEVPRLPLNAAMRSFTSSVMSLSCSRRVSPVESRCMGQRRKYGELGGEARDGDTGLSLPLLTSTCLRPFLPVDDSTPVTLEPLSRRLLIKALSASRSDGATRCTGIHQLEQDKRYANTKKNKNSVFVRGFVFGQQQHLV